jgi:hypothetical protein
MCKLLTGVLLGVLLAVLAIQTPSRAEAASSRAPRHAGHATAGTAHRVSAHSRHIRSLQQAVALPPPTIAVPPPVPDDGHLTTEQLTAAVAGPPGAVVPRAGVACPLKQAAPAPDDCRVSLAGVPPADNEALKLYEAQQQSPIKTEPDIMQLQIGMPPLFDPTSTLKTQVQISP